MSGAADCALGHGGQGDTAILFRPKRSRHKTEQGAGESAIPSRSLHATGNESVNPNRTIGHTHFKKKQIRGKTGRPIGLIRIHLWLNWLFPLSGGLCGLSVEAPVG